ncbi:hypothetical protein OIHEL45_20331 [Sulfitobacter indolifex HEL-45]|uniref:Uncharacterized protein n=1 Tax=Sulfitobacter indolifex HEL-45 TaxID=391624 RepID=A0ABM9X166_9RHOB|nr:hypothetical protein OIHEL45_20331 [Sulfitobacter indolifex HEL-45]
MDVGLQRLVQKATAQTTSNAYARAVQEKLAKIEPRQ